jgi:hypothetical protein
MEFCGDGPLIERLIRAATDREPWATVAWVSVSEWIRAGLRGDHWKIAIRRPSTASSLDFSRFTHPLSRERFEEDAARVRAEMHLLTVEPERHLAPGEFWIGDK